MFDGANVPTKKLDAWNMRAEFYVDIPSDRDGSLLESALGEQSGSGINLFIVSDQVRFYREGREVAVDEVPAVVLYSEVMRDVDLFTAVAGIGRDETWTDQGDRGIGIFGTMTSTFQALPGIAGSAAAKRWRLAFCRTRPSMTAANSVHQASLEVLQGQLGIYRIGIRLGHRGADH